MVTVDIFNMSEDVWEFIQAITDKDRRDKEIRENACLGDREIWNCPAEGETIMILAKTLSDNFLKYFEEVFGRKVRVWIPEEKSGIICEDIFEDKQIFNKLVGLSEIRLVSYCTSVPFINLVSKLREQGVVVKTPEAPEGKDIGVINKYGTKSGIRKTGVVVAPGWIIGGVDEAIVKAAEVYRRNNGVVIKTNKGHAGMGVEIFREGDLPTGAGETEEAIRKLFSGDEYWRKFPIVVEQYVELDIKVGGGSPNVEIRVEESGGVNFLYPCGMRVNKQGEFEGVETGPEIINDEVVRRMKDSGTKLGKIYSREGYRGYFEVDFVAGKDGSLYVTESNIRRTGGTHVYNLGVGLFGEGFVNRMSAKSSNWYKLPEKITFEEMRNKIRGIEFDKKKKEGVIITNENTLSLGRLGYVVFGKNKKRTREIEEKLFKVVT